VLRSASSLMNRLSDHGRGYTCASMRSTERRWRRRIGTSCTASSSERRSSRACATLTGPPFPVDLRVGLAEVERLELPRGQELLAQGPRVGQLDEGRGRRVRVAYRPELRARHVVEDLGVTQGAVTEQEAVRACRLELRREIGRRAQLVRRETLCTTGDLSVAGVEQRAGPPAD